MQTVVETPSYLSDAERLFSLDERKAIVDRLASDPTCGVVIPGGGGIRKVRFGFGDAVRAAALELFIYSAEQTCRCLFWRFLPKTRRPISRLLNVTR